MYVANFGSNPLYKGTNTVSVIDPASDRIESNITGFMKPSGIAYNPADGNMYVANFGPGYPYP